jgi:hypothetical protein
MSKFLIVLGLISFCGCQQEDVHVYRIAKEHPGQATIAQAQGGLHWKVPTEWQSIPSSGMRLASFSYQGKDGSTAVISVVAIPGEAGGDLANVNRWRGQLGLQPIDEDAMAREAEKVRSKAGTILVVDFSGSDSKGEIRGKARMLGGILSLEDKQWFFKMMGEAPTVGQAKASFLQFLRSLNRASNA